MNRETCKRGHSDFRRYNSGKRYCYPCKLEGNRLRNLKTKREVIDYYGGKCACCGEAIFEFLAIDHVNGNGAEHRRQESINTGTATYYWLKKNKFPEGFQVLCHNCNLGRHMNNGTCPHQED